MPMATTARHSVPTPSLPPTTPLTSAGSSESTTAPTSQNHETMIMPSHSRGLRYSDFRRPTVEVHGLAVIGRSAADGAVAGMREAKAQDSNASTMTAEETQPIWLEPETKSPPAMVPIRIAMKVAPSTSAFPDERSPTESWSGNIAYFTGPNSAATMPNNPRATNKSGTECRKKPSAAKPAAKISANFNRRATTDFTYLSASSPPRPERMKKGKMKTASETVTSASPCAVAAP